ncbi:MAG: class I SAM-dependent methyltransferase [Acidobacteriota bacterium]
MNRLAPCAVAVCLALSGCAEMNRTTRVELPTLLDLCETHQTDKCPYHHGYVEFYDKLFSPLRSEARKVFEIGVLRGESMRLWEAYFPRAEIYGIDIKDTSEHDSDRISTAIADQASRSDLHQLIEQIGGDFDIIIDDGGHTMEQQQISFGALFPHLKAGGLYVIEDIHTSFFGPRYGVEPNGQNSTFAMIQGWFAEKEFQSQYLEPEEIQYLVENVSHCLYWTRANEHRSDLFVCWKKQSRDSGAPTF